MLNLKGKQVYLRALEPTDLDFLYKLENDTSVWEVSGTLKPYSKKSTATVFGQCPPGYL